MAGIRLIIYMLLALFKPIGRLVVGSLLILGGLVFGLASHAVTYHQAPTGEYTALTLEDGDVELRFQNGDTYYTITANAFVPALDHIPFPGKRIKSLTYIDEPSTIHLIDAKGNRLEGTDYPVEEFTLANADGTDLQTFTTAEYQENPGGFYRNYWLGGMISVAIGIFLILLTFFLSHRGIQPISKSRFAAQRTTPNQGAWPVAPPPGQFLPYSGQYPPFPTTQHPYGVPAQEPFSQYPGAWQQPNRFVNEQ